MLVKMNFADGLQECIYQAKEAQSKIQAEPDPEEKDENSEAQQAQEERIIADAMYNSVIRAQYQLERNAVFNVQLSGTTFTSGFFSGNQLFTSNVGDSRVILISLDDGPGSTQMANGQNILAKGVTVDHKPDTPKEKQRVLARGGKVAQAQDWRGRFSGPQRVWVKNINSPGLAMSRSLGDTVAHSVGCSTEPDIT